MQNYRNLIKELLESGVPSKDRTGVGTLRLVGRSLQYDLSEGFPLLSLKKTHFKSIAHELIWFLSGDTNIKYLKENGVSIWNEWADQNGDLGPVYGKQWRNFGGIDQLSSVMEMLHNEPESRRMIVCAWNPPELKYMALPPCHVLFQFLVLQNKLHCCVFQRSCDTFLGLPFNIASYALLTQMAAHVAGLDLGTLTWFGSDVHLYQNHVDQAKIMVQREDLGRPMLYIAGKHESINSIRYNDLVLIGYTSHPSIPAPVAV